jgi:hypothetical protein
VISGVQAARTPLITASVARRATNHCDCKEPKWAADCRDE